MSKAIIFGSNGQDGYYLRQLLETKGVSTLGVSRSLPADIIGSVSDYGAVSEIIKREQPDYVFHLAANSSTSHGALWDNHDAIATGTINILEAANSFSKHTKIFLSGSGLQFENLNNPIDENARLVSSSPYVVARNYSLHAARYYRTLGLQVYFGFLFNHDSPKRGVRHMAMKIATYCKKLHEQPGKLVIGNIDVQKEWTYAGDVVNAMWVIVNQQKEFEVIIGSGKAYSIKQWLDVCFSEVGKDWRSYVDIEAGFVAEYSILVSNPARLVSLGWQPQVDFNQLARMMMNQLN